MDENEEEVCICRPEQGEEESENVEDRHDESLKNHWRNLVQRARRKASTRVEKTYVFETNKMFVDAGIEGDELPHEDNIKKVPINGPVDEFLIAETKDRDVEKKSIVSLTDFVEDSRKHEGLMVPRQLNEAKEPCVLKIRSSCMVI